MIALQRRDIGPGLRHVAGLHRRVLDHRLAADRPLQDGDIVGQSLGPVVADVVDAVGNRASAGRRRVEDAEHRRDHIVDVGEVALHAAVVEERDRAALQDRPGEEEGGHVGAPPRAIDGEEAEPGRGHGEKMTVDMADELARLLGRRIQGNRGIDPGIDGERRLGKAAIDRAGAGVDDVLKLGQ